MIYYKLNTVLLPNASKIKNIIFDLGGVLLNINPELTIQQFKAVNNQLGSYFDTDYIFPDFFIEFEKGTINRNTFFKHIHQLSETEIKEEKIIDIWNAMLLDLPKDRLRILENLKQNFKTFLLSNTNEIHQEYFCKQIKEENQDKELDDFFHQTYYSHHLGLRKPDKKIYEFVLNENNLLPEDTLFIDDNKENILSAKELGIHTIWLHSKLSIEKDVFFYKKIECKSVRLIKSKL